METVEDEDLENPSEPTKQTLKIVDLCAQLMYWFVYENRSNQGIILNTA